MYAELTLPLKTFTSLPQMLPDNWTRKILKTRRVENPYIGESLKQARVTLQLFY